MGEAWRRTADDRSTGRTKLASTMLLTPQGGGFPVLEPVRLQHTLPPYDLRSDFIQGGFRRGTGSRGSFEKLRGDLRIPYARM